MRVVLLVLLGGRRGIGLRKLFVSLSNSMFFALWLEGWAVGELGDRDWGRRKLSGVNRC